MSFTVYLYPEYHNTHLYHYPDLVFIEFNATQSDKPLVYLEKVDGLWKQV